jgi:hypothetical protein
MTPLEQAREALAAILTCVPFHHSHNKVHDQARAALAALSKEPQALPPQAPPWMLPLEVAMRIGNEHRVQGYVVQDIAKAVCKYHGLTPKE